MTPGRIQEDLEAQRRYRQDASPLNLRRESGKVQGNPEEPLSNRATYLELTGAPPNEVSLFSFKMIIKSKMFSFQESGSMKSFSSSDFASTLYDDVQSERSKSKVNLVHNDSLSLSIFKQLQTSLRGDEARNSVSSSVVFYDAKDVDSIINQQVEDIYQEVPDIAERRSSRSSKASSNLSIPPVISRPKKKTAPPPPVQRQEPVQEEIYDDVMISSSSSSSSESPALSLRSDPDL